MSIDCVEFCKALADDTRQHILVMLAEKEMCVGDIVAAFHMSQPTISHHLNILKQFKLVTSRKEGLQVYYALGDPRVVDVLDRVCGASQPRPAFIDGCPCP
ncbi:MAG: helix-turn-helix transcriptional regulator, partial [Geobacteraceae bacterium]|nr:helix-turn-helix transcriptional regulator [Geobacteraceae bacterium]